jgi:hypothetical protein
MIAHKSNNGIRVARFESNLYKSNSADMMVFKAKYLNKALVNVEKENITINNNEEKYLFNGNTYDNVYYIWNNEMIPYFKRIE